MSARDTARRCCVALGLAGCLLLLPACTRAYVLTMRDGSQIRAPNKPKLMGTYYVFKDAKGQPVYVAQGRVREIAPASQAEKNPDPFKPSTAR